ncbi:hypothetical protein QAD02_023325 [Eretmocerus hayati]|uniref:Uncharacterized protein n=1 Tax=Eretmocerus hayati TaxID=131215 RepID=A0ACC2PVH2_9HYME|nr:hypothetical protein QAD02_023325 [Eretmocerus hayati]
MRKQNQEYIGGGVKVEEGRIETIEAAPITAKMHQESSSSEKYFTSERTLGEGGGPIDSQTMTKTSSSMMESSTTHTSTKKEYITTTSSSTLSSCPAHQPSNLCVNKTTQSSQHGSAFNGAAPVVQSRKIEEYERIVQDAPDEIRQEKTVIITQDSGGTRQKECKHQVQVQKPCRKQTAPRFTSPVTGMIVDQGANIVLEGIVDGFPLATVTWTKNGQEVFAKNGIKISYDHNHAKLEIKDVKVKDAGRYTCTARNDLGNASSTADLVVKKTIFPPVFGRRLQAQVIKKGDRVVMEVEVTGTPDPTIVWFKDDEPIIEPEFGMKRQGNSYYLLIDKAEKEHSGKYMVQATNAGGEAQSIADFAVFEPTPDTMVEMHKTLVYENANDKNAKKPCCGQPTEIPRANLTTEQITTTMIQPSAAIKTPFPATSSSSTIRTIKSEVTEGSQKACRTEMISSSVESHKSETKSEQKFHMKLEHKPAPFDASKREERTETVESTVDGKNFVDEQTEVISNENIETSTMARKDALNFFESMSKGSDSFPRGPKEMIKLTEEDDGTGPGCDVRVDQLTKNYERSTKFEEVARETPKPDIKSGKKAVQDIFNKFEKDASSRGVDNSMFDFPYEQFKLAPLECTRTMLEDVTASGSPIHGTLTISKLAAQSESAEAMLKGFNLVPEPPPEIGYAPKPGEVPIKRQDVSAKAKQLQESFEKSHSPIDVPIGGVKIFPTAPPKMQTRPQEKTPARQLSIPPPFELGTSDANGGTSTTFTDKQEWSLPDQDYQVSSSKSKQEIELKPEYRCTQTTIESSSSLEKKSFGSKEISVTEKKIERPPSPPKPKPIIYNAETIKVGHTVNTIEEKSIMKKITAECDVKKTETTQKNYEAVKKQTARPWPDGSDLIAPSLVKKVSSDYSKPVVKLYHHTPTNNLQPGTPPEFGYAPGPAVQEKRVQRTYESTSSKPSYESSRTSKAPVTTKKTEEYIYKDYSTGSASAPSQTTNKYSRSSVYSESEYESEIDGALNRTSGYRRVQAPISSHTCRPQSTEPEPPPPSSFEVPSTNLTGPPRPVVTPTLNGSSVQRSVSQYEKDSRQSQQKTSQYQQYASLPKPGSPPVYVQPTKSAPTKAYQPEAPKFKTRTSLQESGYMADTDEPFHLQQNKAFSESCSSFSETKSSFMESKSYCSSQQKKDSSSSTFSQSQSYSSAPKTEVHRSSFVERVVESSPQSRYRPSSVEVKSQVGQTTSRFCKDVASKHMSDMTSSFRSKTEKFSSEIQSDLKKRCKPILKQPVTRDARTTTNGGNEPRTYRDENRLCEYGTKHIDPETGLIYFKYDFGYEFGVVLPGEGKKQQHCVKNGSQSQNGTLGTIEVPVLHETSSNKLNGFSPKPKYPTQNYHTFPRNKSAPKFDKNVRWEPNSESEFSEAEDHRGLNGRKMSAPSTLLIPTSSPSPKWEPTSPSPASLSPSLLSPSPRFGGGHSSNIDSMPGSPWSGTNGERVIPIASEVVKPYIEILPKKAPLFITPLRDIAVVNGQTARFECIVQAEPQPKVAWSKNGRTVVNSVDSEVHYRNGVCRLTLPRTTQDDAGTYTCTAVNELGSTATSATLEVPGNRRSIYGV